MKFEDKDFEEQFTKWLDSITAEELLKDLKDNGLEVENQDLDKKEDKNVRRRKESN